MAKIKTYRGKTEEELLSLSTDDAKALITSRARRALSRAMKNANSKFKGLIVRVRKRKESGAGKAIRTHIRDAVILPEWLGLTFGVHSGKEFKNVEITIEKIGRRLGDFVHTTGRVAHSGPGVGATRGSKFIPLK